MNDTELIDLLEANGFTRFRKCTGLVGYCYHYGDGKELIAQFPIGDEKYYNVMIWLASRHPKSDFYEKKLAEKEVVFGRLGPSGQSLYKTIEDVDEARSELAEYLELI